MFERRGSRPSQCAAIPSIAEKVGCRAEALRTWVGAEIDGCKRPGLANSERERFKGVSEHVVDAPLVKAD